MSATALGLAIVLVLGAQQRNLASHWVYFESREAPHAPKLVLTAPDGRQREVLVAADTVLISYLADKPWGSLRRLAVSLGDTSRALLRFDLGDGGPVKKAELVLEMKLSNTSPVEPFEIALHEVNQAWREPSVTWDSQPDFAEQPVLTTELEPRAQTVRLDVTASVNRGLRRPSSNHGWLVKVVKPLPTTASASPVSNELDRELLDVFTWSESVSAAVAQAKREDKLILAVVRAGKTPDEPFLPERLLLAIAFADPDVRTLIGERFVPVRVHCPPWECMAAPGGLLRGLAQSLAGGPDPLRQLGTSPTQAKPLALVVADGHGQHVATLRSIGTFDADLVRTFLLCALVKVGHPYESSDPWVLLSAGQLDAAQKAFLQMDSREGKYGLCRLAALRGNHQEAVELADRLAESDGPFRDDALVQKGVSLMRLGRSAEARDVLTQAGKRTKDRSAAEAAYYLGCLLHLAQEPTEARKCWQRLSKEPEGSPFALKAKSRLAWPELLAIYERLVGAALPPNAKSTEVPVGESAQRELVERAIDYLLARQTADGTWPQGGADIWNAGVTAVVAHSLLLWSDRFTGQRKQRMEEAIEKATLWLGRYLDWANPPEADSFGAAYTLDFFLERLERNPAYRERAQRAVRLLLSGQCPNGAWSYNRRFGIEWKGGFGGWPTTDKGRTHSINTGLALLALARARASGLEVDAEALERATEILLIMRQRAGVFTYTYPEPLSFMEPDQSIGRAAVCEHALLLLEASERCDLERTLDYFMRYRPGLRKPVKLTKAWASPISSSSYFYFFAYYHAARALRELGEQASDQRLAELRRDILSVAEVDGTWVDYVEIGKPYGTAMALMVLHIADHAD